MEGLGGLIELVLVFSFILGWGLLELRSARRYKKRKAAEAQAPPAEQREPESSNDPR